MDERQSFLQDDDDDTLLFEKLQEHVLEKYPNPERIGCIDHSTLKAWVYAPEELDLSDPKYLHVLKCAECTRELIELRRLRNEQSERANIGIPSRQGLAANWRWAIFASVLLCCLAVAGVFYWRTHLVATPAQVAQSTPVAETIDLSQAGTTRGTDTTTVPVVVLPRRVVSAHIILPNFSPGGKYVVSVTTDRSGAIGKAAGPAVANVQGYHADLTVTLDLRSLPSGTYFLATTHEGDPASYFYPLTVR
ncbi:MAG: hypothetical protein WA673_10870 [Candidatus Acidiferrales bacterium]